MSVVVVTPPAEVLSTETCKAHLRVEWPDDDVLIAGLARAAEQHLAAPAGWLGRSIGLQELELRTSCFRACEALPYGPVQSVSSVAYVDESGATHTVAADVYQLVDEGTIAARLALKAGQSWPFQFEPAAEIRVRYLAGYPEEQEPAPLRAAMLLLVGHWYANREAVTEAALSPVPMAVEALCAPFRIWSF